MNILAQTLSRKTTEADLKVVYSYQSKKTSTTRAALPRDYTHTVYRRRPGSGPADQQKKMDLDWKSGSTTASDTWSFLQLAGTAPNVGAKPRRREEGRGMNEPRGHGGPLYRRGG
jgi:hypothetical protein